MSGCSTLTELLSQGEDARDSIRAPGARPQSFAALRRLVHCSLARLNSFGIGAGDRVAIVLPNGPEVATPLRSRRGDGGTAQPGPSGRRMPFLHLRLQATSDSHYAGTTVMPALVAGISASARTLCQQRWKSAA